MASLFDVFESPEARHINQARLDHLASLRLDISGKRVLEVGAGIGLHTALFEEHRCDIVSTDGNSANVAEMMRRYPNRHVGVLDLDQHGDLMGFGEFEIIYCYGTLYHLRYPDRALAQLAAICSGKILLETVVLPGNYPELQLISEPMIANQALCGWGCRPTRPWVMAALKRHFGYAYTTLDQPQHPDFITDWSLINHDGNLRAVFVGSKQPVSNSNLSGALPVRHRDAPPRQGKRRANRIWLDVGAHRGEHSLAAARNDPSLVVHAFEPQPSLHSELARAAPPNFIAHAMAVSDKDGVAEFRVNRFDAASSLLPIDEVTRSAWVNGDLLNEERQIVVPTTRLDSFMRENNIRAVDFLKIDAQGADFSVVSSLGDRLADVRRIQLEVVPGSRQLYRGAADKATIVRHLTEHGFVLQETEVQSHGQEENLTFSRQLEAAQLDTLANPQTGKFLTLYDISKYAISAGTVELIDDKLKIATAPAQWSYAAVIPMAAAEVPERAIVSLRLLVEVEAGSLQIGILNHAETDFVAMATCDTGTARSIELTIHRAERMGRLVIRNASNEGSSHGWVCVKPAQVDTSAEPQTDEAFTLYDISKYSISAGTVQLIGDRLEITTAPTQWSYAAVIPVDAAELPDSATVTLRLQVEVGAGSLQIGILNHAETEFVAIATIQAGSARTIELTVPRAERMGRLVISNASSEGSSRGWLRLVSAIAETPVEAGEDEPDRTEEASYLSRQLRASAEILASLGTAECRAAEVSTEIAKAAELLRVWLAASGLSLVNAQPNAIGSVLAGMNSPILLGLADHLKTLLPLSPIPGWRFDEFLSRPDLATVLRHALWRTLHQSDCVPKVVLPWHGGTTFACHFDNDLSLAMFVGGTYEPNEFAFLDRVIRPGMAVLDGGANEGAYTLFFAAKVGTAGRVVAIEPSERELARLRSNIRANQIENVEVVAAALAEQGGELWLNVAEPAHAGQNTIGDFIYEGVRAVVNTRVVAVTIAELVARNLSGNIDVIKLDIEGAELRALTGAEAVLKAAKPLLLLEASPEALAKQGGTICALRALLEGAGYRLFCFDKSSGLPMPQVGNSVSETLLAAHRERDWGLQL